MVKKCLIVILLIFIAVSFLTLPRNPLLNDDAALYALSAKNAVLYDQWLAQFVTPGDLSSFLDKPPLGIWMLAVVPKVTAINELTIHFPNVIYYCLLLILLYFYLMRLGLKRIALPSTLIAATSLALVTYSRTPKLDVPLTLFILGAHFYLYSFLRNEKPGYLYIFTILVALACLIKSGFGIIIPGLTVLGLLIFVPNARSKLLKFLFSVRSIPCFLIFLLIVGGTIGLQSMALEDQWVPYLKSITIQSKYNVGYLGLGMNFSIIGILLITLFPWAPLALTSLRIKPFRETNMTTFCQYWFWMNFLFLLFFYRQTDLRTFTALVPPLAILAGTKLVSLRILLRRKRTALVLWSTLFLLIFAAVLIAGIMDPVNPDGIDVSAAITPVLLFVVSLAFITAYFWQPSRAKFAAAFFLVCAAYAVLFYQTEPLADAFNADAKWPGMIEEYRQKGYLFYIYRPPDRRLFMSPDLFYVDFMAGPADRYYWNGEEFKKSLYRQKALVLSETRSWEKLKTKGKVIASDSYSSLILR